MANPHRGEVEFNAGDDKYILSFSANALAELEDKLGIGVVEIGDVMTDPKKIRMTTMRTIFWAGLLDHYPDTDEAKAKSIFSKLQLVEAISLITSAFEAAFPKEVTAGGDADPLKPDGPKDGTGPAS